MKTFKISYFVVVLITVLAIAITLSEPLRVEASHRDRYGLAITATQGKKGGNRTSAMTCDKSPKVCRLKGSSGRDCCRKRCVDLRTNKLNCGRCGKSCQRSSAIPKYHLINLPTPSSLFLVKDKMDRISGLSDELLVKILSFLPTEDAVSTSVLSKQWRFLWMWLPKLEYRDFIDKNLPLHKAPVLESLVLKSCNAELFRPENIKLWVGIVVSRCVRELTLSIRYNSPRNKPFVPLPSSFYTCCSSLTALKLKGESIFVDVPQSVNLPSLKTLKLRDVTYLNDDSLRLLLSNCTALEELFIDRYGEADDNVRALVVKNSTLQRLTLKMYSDHLDVQHVIVTPSLKYFKLYDEGHDLSYSIEHMPKLEEADIDVASSLDELLGSMTSVKRLSLRQFFNRDDESVLTVGAVFNQLEHVKLSFYSDDWSKLLVWLLRISPKLRELNIYVDQNDSQFQYYTPVEWNNRSSVPECLQNTLETFKFEEFMGTQEEGDFLSFFFKNASCLKSTSITDRVIDGTEEVEQCGYKNRSVTCKWKSDFLNRLIGCDNNVLNRKS
ncbi:hypothetical protein HID58_083602 [Brassica napus]|uniref:F-box domain-containing protein n=1 Tax=Brassica napus TaxID=3708 RepID=A0ABQ7YDR7_BRANA|nr:hypothetical protein HID58_083602 [Brassica napus]